MDDDFDYNDTAPCPTRPQEFLLENLCGKKGQSAGGYSPPAPHSAAMRWKEMNEQNMMLQLEEKHLVKKQNVQTSKEAAREIIRKIPVELLAKEWLSKEDATVDMRAYLVDHVLPTLILGVERLLREVDEKGLSATNRFEPEFNPINFLAQYLMRNNPRFSNFAEASPYVRGLREVSEEIKQELFTFEDNRLARIKAESRRKRLEREKVEQALQEAKQQRHEQLTFLYQHFNMPSDKYKVELALVQNALRSFGEIVEQWPKEQQEAAKLGKPFDQTDDTGKALSVDDFVQYLSPFVEHLPMETFDIFIKHMAKCAALYRATAEKESKRIILTNLFLMLDHGGLGLLGRQRLLELLERFWDVYVVNGEFPGTLRNPRRWPVIEVEETDDSMFDAWEEEPDGGLTMSDMYTADTEISKIYQEVHRMATIAAVHDKTAVEKWKIKQLSEKSEGMRWKMYKYNVTDFLNLTDFSYMDTLEAPKQYMNLEEKAAEGKLRYHDLYPMTMTKSKEERDTLVDRKKPFAPEDELAQAEDGENNPLAQAGSMVTDGAQPGVEEEGTSRVDANANAKAGDEILNEVKTPERVDRNNQNETAVEEDTGQIQEISKNGCTVNEDNSALLTNDVSTETFHLHPEDHLNILFPADEVGAETFEETTVKTPSPKLCDSTGQGSGNLNNNMTFPNDVTTESSDSETSNDTDTTVTDTTVTELGLYSDSSRTSISESSEFSDGFLTPTTRGGFRPRFYALPSGTEDYKTAEEEEKNVDEELEEKVSRLREILNSSKVGLLKGQLPTRHDVSRLQNVKNLPHLPHLSDTLHRGVYTDRATSPYDPLPPIPTKKRVRFDPSNTNFNKGDHSLETQPDELTEKKEDGDTGEETEQEQDESLLNATKSKNRRDIGEDIKVGDDEYKVDDQQSVGTDELKTGDKKEIAEVEENDVAEVEEKETAKVEEKEKAEIEEKETAEVEDTQTAEVEDKEPAEIEEKETAVVEEKEAAEVEENDAARVEEKETAEVQEKETAEVEERETAEVEETEVIEEKENDKTVIEKETAEAEGKEPPGKAETQNINQIIDYHTTVSEPGQVDAKEKTDPEKTQLEELTEVDVSNGEQTAKEQAEQEKEEKEKDELDETLAGKAQNTEDPEKKDLSELMKKLSLPVGEFLNYMYKDENINFNKQLIDANINSCYRVRNISTPVVQRTQSQLSAFDINTLNMSQFVVLLETFLGNEPNYDYFERLIKFLKDNYSDTEDEKMERMMKGRREVISAKRKLMIDTLFEKWDNDGSGFLEMEDVQEVLFKYKDGQEVDGIKKAQTALRKASKFNDQRLSKQEFRQLIELVVKEMPGSENFEQLLDFLMNSVERSYAERIRGEARKKWLKQIITAAHFSGTLMDPVYKAVFQALYKDAETHGGEKRISANIALLEVNKMEQRRGPLLLRYSACTPEDCQYMLGKALFKNMKGVSFQAIETGKPVHVPRVANHGSIYFWNYDRTRDDRDGSLVVVPLKDVKKRVFGTLGIDTLCDPYKKSIFITHEVQFFQGVAKAFSIAYHQVEMRRKLLRVAESALLWMSKRCPHITDIAVYLVEPNQMPDGDPVLRKMIVSDKKSPCIYLTEVVRLERKNNLFRDYLFQCMENSDTVMAEAYGERHTATPLRNLSGKALGVVDISIGEIKKLPQFENKEAQRMLRLLQKASKDIAGESQGIERKRLLEAEKDDSSNVTMLFESYMLSELRENISKLDQMAFAELKSYYQPPKVILEICRAALSIFDAEKAGEGQYEDWPVVKNSINNAFINQIKSYDPTKSTEYVKAERVSRYLKGIPHGEVGKYGSIPALLLYNWVFCVLSLIESTIKMREAEEQLQTLIKASNPVTSD